jgi:2-(1,2-epoxy-1,2-dihydrophenyl)acetyl-CoA isomerase
MTETLAVRRDGAVAELRLNRPERLNAFDVPSFERFRHALEDVALDPAVRSVIVTGAGNAFCAGGDVAAMEESRLAGTLPTFFHDLTGEQERAVRLIAGMAKPVVAALPGVAAGGGLSLALACDWRIAAEGTQLVPAFPALGAVPDGGLTFFLPHYVGIGLAQELLFTNARLPADRARELGLLHEVVEAGRLSTRAWERARELAEGPTFAYGSMKQLLLHACHQPLEAQLALERVGAVEAARRGDLPEGIRAFREKRSPRFPPPR